MIIMLRANLKPQGVRVQTTQTHTNTHTHTHTHFRQHTYLLDVCHDQANMAFCCAPLSWLECCSSWDTKGQNRGTVVAQVRSAYLD